MSTKNFNGIPKELSVQSSKLGNASFFDIDEFTNMLKNIHGKVAKKYQKKEYGFDEKTGVTGSDSLSVSIEGDIKNINLLLEKYYELYDKKDYLEKGFEWFDHIKKVDKDKKIKLDEILIEKIKDTNENLDDVWAAVPEILNWENVYCFQYKKRQKEDIDLGLILGDKYQDRKKIDINFLNGQKIKCRDSNNKEIKSWSIYKTLNAEIVEKAEKADSKSKFILNDGNWYEISNDFVKTTEERFKDIKKYEKDLPDYKINRGESKREFNYNEMLSKKMKGVLLDGQNQRVGGGGSKYEICDVLLKDAFIHSKIYGGSGVLSHLFAQGRNSAQILKGDEEQRKKANKLISSQEYKLKKDPSKTHSVVFVILTERNSKEDWILPFFSQISIVNTHSNLEKEGYEMFYKFVPISREGNDKKQTKNKHP